MTQFKEQTGAQTEDFTSTVFLVRCFWLRNQCSGATIFNLYTMELQYMVPLLILHIFSQIQTVLTALFTQCNDNTKHDS